MACVKQLKQRAEKLESASIAAHRERSAGVIKLANRGTHAKVLVALDNVAIATPDGRLLFRINKQFICKNDRIVLLGARCAICRRQSVYPCRAGRNSSVRRVAEPRGQRPSGRRSPLSASRPLVPLRT